MLPADVDLGPDERRHEIAVVLAAGILRLLSRPESAPSAGQAGVERRLLKTARIPPRNPLTCPRHRALMSPLVNGPRP